MYLSRSGVAMENVLIQNLVGCCRAYYRIGLNSFSRDLVNNLIQWCVRQSMIDIDILYKMCRNYKRIGIF